MNLQRARKEKRWSQEELAHQCGLDRTYISGIERGVRNPTIKVLSRIAEPLEVDAYILLKPANELPK